MIAACCLAVLVRGGAGPGAQPIEMGSFPIGRPGCLSGAEYEAWTRQLWEPEPHLTLPKCEPRRRPSKPSVFAPLRK